MGKNKSVFDLTGDSQARFKASEDYISKKIRCCIPAIFTSINYENMTAEVKPVIRERIKANDGTIKSVELPMLLDVPIVFPSSGRFSITFPVEIGDECLVYFADMCIDSWWQSGGIQDQFESRRHDLSDAFCIPSRMSQVKKDNDFNINYLEIKNNVTGVKIEVRDDKILIDGINIKDLEARIAALEGA